jgi:hypothetical protein
VEELCDPAEDWVAGAEDIDALGVAGAGDPVLDDEGVIAGTEEEDGC